MEKLDLLVGIDTTYIIDQIISNYVLEQRILLHTKNFCLKPDNEKEEIGGAYAYSIQFENINDVLNFGFDCGRSMKAAAELKEMHEKNSTDHHPEEGC